MSTLYDSESSNVNLTACIQDICYEGVKMAHLLELAERQINKKQDLVLVGEGDRNDTGEHFHWVLVCDGHGSNTVIDCLRTCIDWQHVVQQPEPGNYIEGALDNELQHIDTMNTGSTFALARIYHDRVEEITIGDTQIALFLDGQFHHISVEHNTQNKEEMERIQPRLNAKRPFERHNTGVPHTSKIATNRILSSCLFVNTPKKDSIIPRISQIAHTQALGHNSVTGIFPTVTVTPICEFTDIRVVVASNGFWDVHIISEPLDINYIATLSAEELAQQAENRWKQEWTYIPNLKKPEESYEAIFDRLDDISIGIYHRKNVFNKSLMSNLQSVPN